MAILRLKRGDVVKKIMMSAAVDRRVNEMGQEIVLQSIARRVPAGKILVMERDGYFEYVLGTTYILESKASNEYKSNIRSSDLCSSVDALLADPEVVAFVSGEIDIL